MEPNSNQQPGQEVKKVNPMSAFSDFRSKALEAIKTKFAKKPVAPVVSPELSPSAPSSLPPVSQAKMKVKIPKKILVLVGALIVAVIIFIVTLKVLGQKPPQVGPSQTPSPSPTPTPVEVAPSQYADDEDVAQIQEYMEELDRDLKEASFREDRLRVPSLDWDVSFK